jgi:16S rRNA (cytidine1402-2'-O)-methyltransferase
MAGTLSIVSTPIGHLDDITLRALNVLRAVALIAAEDTRRTAKLLAHFGIKTPTTSFHEHNTRSKMPGLVRRLLAGESLALVSDAGTPLLSDPGTALVRECVRNGIAVDAVPGPSAPLALAVIAGFDLCPWTVHGFPPSRSSDRKRWFRQLADCPHPVSFLESPHRIVNCLEQVAEFCGDRPIVVGRELTKIHQTVYRGSASSVLQQGIDTRGEFTVMLGSAIAETPDLPLPSDTDLATEIGELTNNSAPGERRSAIRTIAKRYGRSAREVYAAVERGKAR